MELLLLGVLAGALTTVTGMGGGLLLLTALSLMSGPREALTVTAPALFVGNLHRALIFRAQIDKQVGAAFVAGALPGSLVGALLVVSLPLVVIKVMMVVMVSLALARALGWWRFSPDARAMIPAAAGVGMVAATSGGAGLMVGPLLMSAGLSGEAYVSTSAIVALAMHLGRIVGYGLGGILTARTLPIAAALAAAILCGNLLGAMARRHIPARLSVHIELAALLAATALCLAGALR